MQKRLIECKNTAFEIVLHILKSKQVTVTIEWRILVQTITCFQKLRGSSLDVLISLNLGLVRTVITLFNAGQDCTNQLRAMRAKIVLYLICLFTVNTSFIVLLVYHGWLVLLSIISYQLNFHNSLRSQVF